MALDPNLAKIIADAIQPHLNEINKSNSNFRQTASQHNDNLKQIIGQIYSAINYNNSNIDDLISSMSNSSQQSQRIAMEMRSVYQAVSNNTNTLFNLLNEIKDFNNVNRQVLSKQAGFFNNLSQNLSQFSKKTLVSLGNLGKRATGGAAIGTGAIQTGGAIAALGGIGAAGAIAYTGNEINESLKRMKQQASESAAGLREGAEIAEGVPGPGGGAPSGKPSTPSGRPDATPSGKPTEPDGSKPKLAQGLGSLSAKYESGGRGVGFISSGAGDPGGQSYGVHQLSSAYSMGAFLRSPEGKPYADQFKGLTPGSPQFNEVYRKIAKQSPKEFEDSQKAFYTRTHYNPLLEHAKKLGYDVNNRGIQEALFSMSIQHGKAKLIVSRAAKNGVGQNAEEQLRGLYSSRREYVSGLSKMPERTRQSVLNRYDREEKDALEYSKQKEENKDDKQSTPDASPSSPTQQQTPNARPSNAESAPKPDSMRSQSPQTLREDINYASARIKKQAQLSPDTINALNKLKGLQDFTVTSTTGGSHARGSMHYQHNNPEKTGGRAVDIRIRDLSIEQRQQLVENARKAGFNRIGIARDHLHLDMKPGSFTVFDEGGGARAFGKDASSFRRELERIPVISDETQEQQPGMTKPQEIIPDEMKPTDKPKPVTQPSKPRGMLEGLNPKDAEQQLRGAEEKPKEGEILNQAATQRDIERMTQQQTAPIPQQEPTMTAQMGSSQQSPTNVSATANWAPRMGTQDYADISAYYRQKNVHTNRESVQSMYT